jgi:hypothetical protein
VAKHDDESVVPGQARESAVELVAKRDATELVALFGLIEVIHADLHEPESASRSCSPPA